jgi:CheY-like chemotaxis protein
MHIDRSAGPSPDREQAVTSSSSSSPVENRAPRVLVADDDDATRMVLAESLRADGYEVLEAANGRELFWAIETSTHDHALDLVVADIRMPAYSGLEVAEAWAEIGLPRTILMTAYPDDCVRSRVEGLGMRLIDKPCDVQELLRLVRELVGSPHGRRDPDSHPGEGGSRVG